LKQKNMVHEKVPKEFNQEIKADRNHAQILIKIIAPKTFEGAKSIIEDLGVQIIETKHLLSNWVLLKLDVKDMRNVVLKLTEHGFLIRGINALDFSILRNRSAW
jgi:hypothetical protein